MARRLLATALAAACGALAGCGGHADLFKDGGRVFVHAGCGGCHAAKSVHARGGVGPDFDTSEQLSRAQIRRQLELGEGGMPSYRGRLSRRQEEAVTEFVFETMHARRE